MNRFSPHYEALMLVNSIAPVSMMSLCDSAYSGSKGFGCPQVYTYNKTSWDIVLCVEISCFIGTPLLNFADFI
jgi:hypothetical protein